MGTDDNRSRVTDKLEFGGPLHKIVGDGCWVVNYKFPWVEIYLNRMG